ncbi:MAG: TatD family hydrolase [Deltaproteobacteria bacterium]|jgi:TatD DNase family protein|nr:TatD family hydrolase [Deltaproteobacteria bacterium]
MDIIDSHCHLFLEELAYDSQAVLSRAYASGVSEIINVGLDWETSLTVTSRAKVRKPNEPIVRAAVGWHPNETHRMSPSDVKNLANLARDNEVVALGEIGLDYYRHPESAKTQKKFFLLLLEAAIEIKKPVIIHCRDAWPDLIEILKPLRGDLAGVLLHCFSGSTKEVEAGLKLKCHFSFAGPLTFPKAKELRDALLDVPRNLVMIETDAPFLAPQPKRGKRNEPALIVHQLKTLAQLWQMDIVEAAKLTSQNAREYFGLTSLSA